MFGLAWTNRWRLARFGYGGKRKRASRRPSTHACVLNWTVCSQTPSAKHPLHRQTSPAKLRCCENHTPTDLPVKTFFDGEKHVYFCVFLWYRNASQTVYVEYPSRLIGREAL